MLSVAALRLRFPATSIARMPPVLPSQLAAVRVLLKLTLEYWGTRTTSNFCWVWPAVVTTAW